MKKRLEQSGFHIWIVALIVVVVAAVGFAGWYVWDKNKADDNTNVTNPTPTPSVTVTATPTPTVVAETKNELDTLREFCQGDDPDTVVGGIKYIETNDGKFGSCGIGSRTSEGGAMLISAYVNESWVRVWAGNGIMDNSLCAQYKLPSTIYADCIGFYE